MVTIKREQIDWESGDWKLHEDNADGRIKFEHKQTGATFELDGSGKLSLEEVGAANINDLVDASSSATVYDSSTETFGDGSQNANFDTVDFDDLNGARYATNFDGANGGEQIQNAIDDAVANTNSPIVVVTGDGPDDVSNDSGSLGGPRTETAWALTSSIEVPDNVTLIFINCYLFLKAGSDDNIIRNEGADSASKNYNIDIIGIGNAIFDGNASNQTTLDRETDGSEYNLGLRFYPIDDLNIENIRVRNTNAWGVKAESGENWNFKNLEFDQDESTPNQDGLDIVGPARDVDIDWLTGVTGDDTLAIRTEKPVGGDEMNEGPGGDIYDVHVGSIKSDPTGNSNVRLQAKDGTTLSDLTIEHIDSQQTFNGYALQFGFTGASNSKEEIKNVSVHKISAKNTARAVRVTSPCSDVSIDSIDSYINSNNGSGNSVISIEDDVEDFDVSFNHEGNLDRGVFITSGTTVDRLTIGPVVFNGYDGSGSPIGNVLNPRGTLNDVVCEDWNVKQARYVFGGPSDATVNGLMRDVQAGTIGQNIFNDNRTYNLKFVGQMPHFDFPPAHITGTEVIATSSWDPDSDGNGEKVISDGASWIEIADMPNI